jgi:integral membrane sensor domain MASE1
MKGVLHTWLWLLGLALAYFASGQLGLTVPYLGAFVSLIWPPTGLAVAVLWRGGLSRWPGIWLGWPVRRRGSVLPALCRR